MSRPDSGKARRQGRRTKEKDHGWWRDGDMKMNLFQSRFAMGKGGSLFMVVARSFLVWRRLDKRLGSN